MVLVIAMEEVKRWAVLEKDGRAVENVVKATDSFVHSSHCLGKMIEVSPAVIVTAGYIYENGVFSPGEAPLIECPPGTFHWRGAFIFETERGHIANVAKDIPNAPYPIHFAIPGGTVIVEDEEQLTELAKVATGA